MSSAFGEIVRSSAECCRAKYWWFSVSYHMYHWLELYKKMDELCVIDVLVNALSFEHRNEWSRHLVTDVLHCFSNKHPWTFSGESKWLMESWSLISYYNSLIYKYAPSLLMFSQKHYNWRSCLHRAKPAASINRFIVKALSVFCSVLGIRTLKRKFCGARPATITHA